jgi:hypothetical protein
VETKGIKIIFQKLVHNMEYSHPYFFISGISVIVAHHTSSVEEGEQNLRTAHRSLFNIEFALVRQVSLGLKIET